MLQHLLHCSRLTLITLLGFLCTCVQGAINASLSSGAVVSNHTKASLEKANGQNVSQRVLLYSVVGECDPKYRTMLAMMAHSALFHLGPNVHIAVIALDSCALYASTEFAFIHHFLLLPRNRFAPAHASLPSQASAIKLRVFTFFPAILSYDVAIYLDADILVQANVLQLLGPLARNTLYVTDEVRSRAYPTGPPDAFFSTWEVPDSFNAGQFVFRPSRHLQRLFQQAYEGYLKRPNTVSYEQGMFNAIFVRKQKLSYTLTHIVALHAQNLPPEAMAGFGLLHFCGTPSDRKLAYMLHRNASAYPAVAPGALPLLLPFLRHWANSTHTAHRASWLDSPTLISRYVAALQALPEPHVCVVGLANALGAAAALWSHPAASAVVLAAEPTAGGPDPAIVVGRLRRYFPERQRVR
eukprot:EG_transcript_14398